MLGTLLTNDLMVWMDAAPDGVPRRVLLWLDPESQFKRLIPLLEPALKDKGLRLFKLDSDAGMGQLALKIALLQLEAAGAERAIAYLPGFGRSALEPHPDGRPPALWSVYDYRFKGCVWSRAERWDPGSVGEPITLSDWLARHGLQFADGEALKRLMDGGESSLLARYVLGRSTSCPEHWPRPLRVSDVVDELAGDPREALRGLLSAPTNELKRWGYNAPLVLDRIARRYGLIAPEEDYDGESLADSFAIQLALAEAWQALGEPNDFPFLARLPQESEQRQQAAQFLRDDLLGHAELGPRFRARMRRLEPKYDLSDWASQREGEPWALPLLARARWQAFLRDFGQTSAEGWKATAELLLARRDNIEQAARNPQDGTREETAWFVLAEVLLLLEGANEVASKLDQAKSCAALVEAYSARWWLTDWRHLRVRSFCHEIAGLEEVQRFADHVYFDYASRLNQRFTDLFEAEENWPPKGTTGTASLSARLWQVGSTRRAVILCDAFRWDFAMQLKERLDRSSCILQPVISTLPTETAFGMASLLPLQGEVSVAFEASRLVLKDGSGQDVSGRSGRKALLSSFLSHHSGPAVVPEGQSTVDFMDLDDVLKARKIPAVSLLVVFDNSIDEQGHKGTEGLPALVERFVGNMKRAIDRLHEAGFASIHLVADHGFLLIPPEEVDSLGTPQVLPAEVMHKDVRWAVLKPDTHNAEIICLPLPLAPESGMIGVPRGIRTLMKAPPYLHGGISLQECVLPYFVSEQAIERVKVGLDLSVTSPHLSGGTVPVVLRPVLPGPQPPLGGVQPLYVRLWVETARPAPKKKDGFEPGGQIVAEPLEIELRPHVEELKPPVYLQEGLDLQAGQQLLLRAVDKETGKGLATIVLTLLVDWE